MRAFRVTNRLWYVIYVYKFVCEVIQRRYHANKSVIQLANNLEFVPTTRRTFSLPDSIL